MIKKSKLVDNSWMARWSDGPLVETNLHLQHSTVGHSLQHLRA